VLLGQEFLLGRGSSAVEGLVKRKKGDSANIEKRKNFQLKLD